MSTYSEILLRAQRLCDELASEYSLRTQGGARGYRGERWFLSDKEVMKALRIERDNILIWREKLDALPLRNEAISICAEIGIPFTLE